MKIREDIDYESLSLFENHLVHELHRFSDEEFVEKYKNVNNLCSLYEEKALLSGILQLVSGVASGFKYDGFILPYLDFLDYKDDELSDEDLNMLYEKAIPSFRDCGVLYNEFGGFADGTYYRNGIYK